MDAQSLHRVEAQHPTLEKIIDFCLKTEHIYGTLAFHTTDRITPGVFRLHPNSVWLHFDVHKHGIQWTDQSSRWGIFTGGQVPRTWENNLENTYSSNWKFYSQPTTSHLTTNFTTKLANPKYVTYGYIKSWNRNSCPKTQHTRTKSTLMPVSEMMGTWYGRRHLRIM